MKMESLIKTNRKKEEDIIKQIVRSIPTPKFQRSIWHAQLEKKKKMLRVKEDGKSH
jgi:hypothetical protein